MRPRWRKVISDLIDNKARTILVVFSIAVGVFAIGVIAGAYVIISEDMGLSYAANNPSNIEIRMNDFDQDLLNTIRNFEGIKEVEARRVFNLKVRIPGETQWITVDVVSMENFDENKINLLQPVTGGVSPEKNQILLERDVLEELNISPGENLEIQQIGRAHV